jgi:hypothetical protein
MARTHDGRAAVDAPPAVGRMLTRQGAGGESWRGHGCPPKSGSGCSRASMRALRLGGGPRPGSDLPAGVGTHQDRPGVVGRA